MRAPSLAGLSLSHLCCAAVQRQIDDAAEVVTALMEDINERLFVPTAIADITGVSSRLVCAHIIPGLLGPPCCTEEGPRLVKVQ